MRLGILAVLAGVMLMWGCSSPNREEMAALAAEGYYRHLLRGEYDAFMQGKAGLDSMPEDYRNQMRMAYRQFMTQQEESHRGVSDVRISNSRTDSALQCVNVCLVLCFGDSTNEEVVVPMVERNGSFRMK